MYNFEWFWMYTQTFRVLAVTYKDCMEKSKELCNLLYGGVYD